MTFSVKENADRLESLDPAERDRIEDAAAALGGE